MRAYPFPRDLFLGLIKDMASGRRSLSSDARAMVSRMEPPPVVTGVEHIPRETGLVVVANHYERRGLWIGWPGAVVTKAVADRRGDEPPVHWLVTGGLRFCQWKKSGPQVPFSNLIFQKVARTYQMSALPLTGRRRRAAVMKHWAAWARRGEALGMFPEGLLGSAHTLGPPDPGFGKLCHVLARIRCVFQPCGIYEESAVLTVRFGNPLEPDSLLCEKDDRKADMVMEAIAGLLPPRFAGPYAEALERD